MAVSMSEALNEVLRTPEVVKHLLNAPEEWFWSLTNSVFSAFLTTGNVHFTPTAFIHFVTALFAVFQPGIQIVKDESFYATPVSQLRSSYDYIIVGGGSAGCLLANRLSKDNNVLLIEAGGVTNILNKVPILNLINMNNPLFDLDYRYMSVPQKHAFKRITNQQAHMGGGKGMGGSSHLNFQIYSRAFDEDYDRWERIYGAKGWNANEMVHFMKKHQNMLHNGLADTERHQKGGELDVSMIPMDDSDKLLNIWTQTGSQVTSTQILDDHNNGVTPGFSLFQQLVSKDGSIKHSARAFIDPIREERPERLHILLNTVVHKVLLDGNTKAVGVIAQKCIQGQCEEDTQEFRVSKEVVLSAGSARSPQILMLSGIGEAKQLENIGIPQKVNLPGVGGNLHDHVVTFGSYVVFPKGKGYMDYQIRDIAKFFSNGSGQWRTAAHCKGVAFIHTKYSQDPKRPDIELVLLDLSPGSEVNRGAAFKFGLLPEDHETFNVGTEAHRNMHGIQISAVLMRSKSRGKIELKSSSPLDHPIFDLQYLSDPLDRKALADSLRIINEISEGFEAMGGERSKPMVPGCEKFEKDSDEYRDCHVESYTMSVWHMAGTCRMGGDDDNLAVVDSRLRVRGVQGLRVADASVMPEETTGHMVATVYGIAEKAADMILKDNDGRGDPKVEL